MRFAGVPLSMQDDLPIPQYPSPIAAFSQAIEAYISASDTIRVCRHGVLPSIVGRAIHIASSPARIPSGDCIHPFISDTSSSSSDPIIQLQWYLINDDFAIPTRNHFPSRTASIWRACGNNLPEAAPTNCFVWISVNQASEIVFFVYSHDCTKQVFGPVHNRINTFLIRSSAIFRQDDHLEFTIEK